MRDSGRAGLARIGTRAVAMCYVPRWRPGWTETEQQGGLGGRRQVPFWPLRRAGAPPPPPLPRSLLKRPPIVFVSLARLLAAQSLPRRKQKIRSQRRARKPHFFFPSFSFFSLLSSCARTKRKGGRGTEKRTGIAANPHRSRPLSLPSRQPPQPTHPVSLDPFAARSQARARFGTLRARSPLATSCPVGVSTREAAMADEAVPLWQMNLTLEGKPSISSLSNFPVVARLDGARSQITNTPSRLPF